MTPFTSNPGMPPWLPQWGGTRDPSALCPGHCEGLHRFFLRRWRFCASFYVSFKFFFVMVYAAILSSTSDSSSSQLSSLEVIGVLLLTYPSAAAL